MARKPRNSILGEGGHYHVYSRFSSRRFLLAEPAAKEKFHELMRFFCERYGVVIHGYCLMSNHFHMLCSIGPGGNLSRAFAKIKEMFSKWTHRQKHEKEENNTSDGGLWKERFRACLVEDDRYAMTLLRYIENNPVRAGLVKQAWEYEYSSNRYYVLGEPMPGLVPLETYLGLSNSAERRKKIYRQWFEEKKTVTPRNSDLPWFQTRFLGSEKFIESQLIWLKENIVRKLRWKKGDLGGDGGLFFMSA
jgi:putative transposase